MFALYPCWYFYSLSHTHTHTHTHTVGIRTVPIMQSLRCGSSVENISRGAWATFHFRKEHKIYEGVSKSFRTESITKYTLTTINTRWDATQRVMVAKLIRLIHKIAIQLHLVAESCTISHHAASPETFGYTLIRYYGTNCRTLHWLALLFTQPQKFAWLPCYK
jgi:hypothetical protein